MQIEKPQNTGQSWGLTDLVAEVLLKRIDPAKIVDFGAGVGKYGDMVWALLGDNRRVDAVEVFEPSAKWLETTGRYKNVFNVDLKDWVAKENYDLGIFGDVLEHLEYEEIKQLLKKHKEAGTFKYTMIIVPLGDVEQGSCGGNKAEEHKSIISEVLITEDLKDMGYKIDHRYITTAIGPKGDYQKMLLVIK